MGRRIGVLGGSFDPVHFGHLWIAMHAIEQLELEELRLVPAAQSPLKPAGPVAADTARAEMLRLAIGGTERLRVDTTEIDRGGVSYTVDTLEAFDSASPASHWFFLMGSDSLATIAQWHRPERLLELATIAVVRRGGDPPPDYGLLDAYAPDEVVDRCRASEVVMPQIEVSSSDLRRRIAGGRPIRFLTPRAVEAYIAAQSLYASDAAT